MSKGTKEKVALILAMSRNAKLYILDEPDKLYQIFLDLIINFFTQ